jgi:hypothetical protein
MTRQNTVLYDVVVRLKSVVRERFALSIYWDTGFSDWDSTRLSSSSPCKRLDSVSIRQRFCFPDPFQPMSLPTIRHYIVHLELQKNVTHKNTLQEHKLETENPVLEDLSRECTLNQWLLCRWHWFWTDSKYICWVEPNKGTFLNSFTTFN